MTDTNPADSTVQSPAYYYVCSHTASNTPCSLCFPGATVMPDNWVNTYVPPTPPTPDQSNLGGTTP